MDPYSDPSRALLGVIFAGGFSDAARAHALTQVDRAVDALSRSYPPPLLAACGSVTDDELAALGTDAWIYYQDHGDRRRGDGRASLPWTTRERGVVDAAQAIAGAVTRAGAVQSSGAPRRHAMLLVCVGDQASDDFQARLWERLVAPACDAGVAARFVLPDEGRPTVWIDVETTGRTANLCGVIEIGAVLCDSSSRRVYGQLELRAQIEPWMMVEPEALVVNKYDEELWRREGVPHLAAAALVAAWLPPRFSLGAYSASFDRGFVRAMHARGGQDEPGIADTVDPLPRVRRELKAAGRTEGARLTQACAYYGISTENAHTALFDAHAARLVYLALLGEDVATHARAVGM